MTEQKFRIGQKVLLSDAQEGFVTDMSETIIWIDGFPRDINQSPHSHMTRTITVLAEPSPPDEPTGLGAVVRDIYGDLWSLTDPNHEAPWGRCGSRWSWRPWEDIEAAEVLFDGVSDES